MKAFYVVAVIAAVAASVSGKAAVDVGVRTDSYDCSGKPNGNYYHPTDCTRFISCSNGIAYEMDCASCHPGDPRCIRDRTVFDQDQDKCLWADETECRTDGGPQPTTTEGTPGNPGDECNPEECFNDGDCQHYWRCDNGTLVREECGEGLFWNPFEDDCSTRQIHGGNCDKYDNLCQATKDAYHNSKECLQCFWEEDGKCNRSYRYQAPNLKHRNVQTLTCSEGLVFVEAKETCQRCEDARDENGNACCAGSNIIF